jgi:protein SCO1/2
MRAAVVAALLLASAPANALPNGAELNPILGSTLDLHLAFTDSANRKAPLSAFTDGKPSLILLGYHRCPNLCGLAQLDLAEGLAAAAMAPASYSVLFASVDPEETPADALAARGKLEQASTGIDLSAWHFLSGDRHAVDALTSALGATVRPSERGLYVHPIAVAAITGEGRLSRLITGLDYTPRDLRLAIVEASAGRIGTLGDRILLLCSSFDTATGRYTDVVMAGLRLASLATLIALGAGILLLARRGRA